MKRSVAYLILSTCLATQAGAQTIDFSSGFGAGVGLQTNQNWSGPMLADNVLRLTDDTGNDQAGSAFWQERVNIAAFTSSFEFRLHGGSDPMADGFTFAIQGTDSTALGPSGGGLGYGPDSLGGAGGIGKSVAVKFDLYSNAGEGTNSTGLYADGEGPILPTVDLTGTGIDLHSQNPMRVDLDYDGFTLGVSITDLVSSVNATQFYSVDIASYVQSDIAWVGFTGGTGGLTSIQDIRSWRFDSEPVPEPATWICLGLGAALLRRRRGR